MLYIYNIGLTVYNYNVMAMSRWKDDRDEELKHENVISLKKFPPKLRKLAKYLLQMDQTMTIKQAWWTGFLGLNTNILCTLSLFISSYISGGSAWRIFIIP